MTLTQAAIITRRGIIILFLAVFLAILSKIGLTFWQQYRLSTAPLIEEKAENKFGSLPQLKFTDTKVSSSNFSYAVDTATGGFPQTPKFIKVYFIPQGKMTLLAPEKAQELALKFGFTNEPQAILPTKYSFSDNKEGILIADLIFGNFSFKRMPLLASLNNDPDVPADDTSNNFPEKETLVASFKNFLIQNNLLTEELQNGRSLVSYDQQNEQNSETAIISLWPKDINNLPVVTADFQQGLVKASINKGDPYYYLSLDYYFWPVDLITSSTYEIKTPEEALENLKSGLGFVSLEPASPRVSLTSLYLAYYQSEEYSPYLQPVFVFEGPEFIALVPAVKSIEQF